jgi:hypothetical protein
MSVVGFPTVVGNPVRDLREQENILGRFVRVGEMTPASTFRKERSEILCPFCHRRLREVVFSGPPFTRGRVVAVNDKGDAAVDVLPEGMRVLYCKPCQLPMYQPAGIE